MHNFNTDNEEKKIIKGFAYLDLSSIQLETAPKKSKEG